VRRDDFPSGIIEEAGVRGPYASVASAISAPSGLDFDFLSASGFLRASVSPKKQLRLTLEEV
jgi:hypothetical protein